MPRLPVAFAFVALTVAACTGTDPSFIGGAQDGGKLPDGGDPPATGDVGCAPVCDGDVLRSCETRTECALGCSTEGVAHCKVVVPSGLLASTSVPAGVLAATLQDLNVFDTTSGKITRTGTTPATVRDRNTDAAKAELVGDIGFELLLDSVTGTRMAVWSFASLDLASGATIHFLGSYPVAFVVGGTTALRGVVDLRAFDGTDVCTGAEAGPGGLPGGTLGAGAGGTSSSSASAGAGGGGHCGKGGAGGGLMSALGGDASLAISGTAAPRGGGGGGGTEVGGGGGGAIQIVSSAIVVGGGAGAGGINAGGCGGKPGTGNKPGGGGAGGTIILEAGTVRIETNGHLAAMGGGGAAGIGIAGGAADLLAPGGGGTNAGDGGKGSAEADRAGGNGSSDTGSGGGGVGVIRVRVTESSAARFPDGAVYPAFGATECADVNGSVPTR